MNRVISLAENRLRLSGWVWLLPAGAALLLVYGFDPAVSGFYPRCPFHLLTGLYCPGCGSLRALHQLLHGNLGAALDLNPLMVLTLPFIAASLIRERLASIRRPAGARALLPASWIWALLTVIILFGVLRNVPMFPFDILAP